MPSLKKFFLFAAIGLFTAHAPCRADQSRLAEADKLALSGEWEKARQIYRSELEAAGDATRLPGAFFYNYGTVLAKAGAVGEAYIALTRAAFSLPLDRDARHNLRRLEQTVPAAARAVQPALWLGFWPSALRVVPWEAWLTVALACSAIALFALRPDKLLPWITGGAAALLFLLAGAQALQSRLPVYGTTAITGVKSGPGKSYTDIVSLDPGSLVNVEESREGWLKLRFSRGGAEETVGWAEPAALLRIN